MSLPGDLELPAHHEKLQTRDLPASCASGLGNLRSGHDEVWLDGLCDASSLNFEDFCQDL